MSEPFRTRVEPPQSSPEPQGEAIEVKSDHLEGDETPAQEPLKTEEKDIEIWEGLNHNHKYALEYFDIHELADDFKTKMDVSKIDKYIKQALDEKGYAKTIDNYRALLQEIEAEAKTDRLELFERISRIVGYMGVLSKIKKLNEIKGTYVDAR